MKKIMFKNFIFLFVIGVSVLASFAQTPEPTPFPGPNDPYLDIFTGSAGINSLPKAWAYTTGSPTVKVAILSSGADTSHSDIKDSLLKGFDATNSGSLDDVTDDHGMGTALAGLLVSKINDYYGTAGIAPGVKILPVKVFRESGSSDSSFLANGLKWAVDNGANIVIVTVGSSQDSSVVKEACEYANSKGVLMVLDSGKDLMPEVTYPSKYLLSNMIVVGSVSPNSSAISKNYKTTDSKIIQFVSTSNATTTLPMKKSHWGNTQFGRVVGNFVAVGIVAGAAALAKSLKPNITNAVIKEKLCATSFHLVSTQYKIGCGVVDIGKFIKEVAKLP